MVAVFHSSIFPIRPDDADEHQSEERLNHVEKELTGLRKRLDSLLSYIRQDDMAPLTPFVRTHEIPDRKEQADV